MFEIKKGDVIAITGAGGKTSLLNYLSMNLRGRKVISTSTKIYRPSNGNVIINEPFTFREEDEIIVTAKELRKEYINSSNLSDENASNEKPSNEKTSNENSCNVNLGNVDFMNENRTNETHHIEKLCGINEYAMDSNFDYYIYEADGSKGYPLKGWRKGEPVILDKTTKTIGVLDITVLGKKPKDVVFRSEELSKITKLDEVIKKENLIDIINHDCGLFKNSLGMKILYINKVESKYHEMEAINVILNSHVDLAIIGSIKNKEFKTIKS